MAERKVVHIYAETDTPAPTTVKRYGGYVLECIRKNGEPATREEFMEMENTYHGVILQMFVLAIKRINQPCEIHLHTQNAYILNMVDKFLSTWAENDFHNSKGEPVKNADIWEHLWQQVKTHKIVIEHGMHPYYGWIQTEIMKIKKEKAAQLQ